MTSHSDMTLNKKSKIPWYAYGVGGVIYTALAGWLLTESSPLAWICLLSAPVGFSMPGESGNTRHNTEVRPDCTRRLRTESLAEGDGSLSSPRRDLSSW